MDTPLEISFVNTDRSAAVEKLVRERTRVLARHCDRLLKCRVVIEMVGRHHRKGRKFRARIDMKLPGRTIVVGKASESNPAHEDVYVAVRHAFDAARRQAQDFARRRRGDIKAHEAPPHGRIARLFPDEGYGFVRLADGQEIYFHRNAVVGAAFEKLAVGAEVRVSVHEDESDKGPQAGTVRPVGRHHIGPVLPE
ncbi:MAG: HPF/RaiA family ribosome-associated protein [Rhodospirillales bacterium]